MKQNTINLKEEVQNTLQTDRCKYSFMAKLFFLSMDVVAGRKTTVPKAMFLEMLASVPYRKWESKHYSRLSFGYKKQDIIKQAYEMIEWGREAQDNEYWHLVVLNEKLKIDGGKYPWYLNTIVTHLAMYGYMTFSWLLSRLSMKKALLFNALFEDHAEHTYAEFVRDNPQLEQEIVTNELVKKYADVATWADVLSRIALDERNHRNNSFKAIGKDDLIHHYVGMPEM